MLVYKEGRPEDFRAAYLRLWREHKRGFRSFAAMDSHFEAITQGKFLVLRNRFQLTTLQLLSDGRPVIMATFFEPTPGWPDLKYPASIGSICASADLRPEQAEFFWSEVGRRHGEKAPVGPMNGHSYLGFGLAPDDADGERVAFQIGAPHGLQDVLFGRYRERKPYRRHYTLETAVTPELLAKIDADLARKPKTEVTVRAFSHLNARRDLDQLNALVNRAFIEHFDFAPLTDDENWDILKVAVPLLRGPHFYFVEHDGRPVGFCFGMRDYNRVLRNDADWKNLARLTLPRRWRRARILHKGILPEYSGQGLVNQARHRCIQGFAREGVEVIENSYIDEGNINSLKNVGATDAKPLYEYRLITFE